jgi:hypothetical protein
MEDIVFRSIVGTGGFFATLSLTPVNEILGFCVGVATMVYMTASAIKVIKELRK